MCPLRQYCKGEREFAFFLMYALSDIIRANARSLTVFVRDWQTMFDFIRTHQRLMQFLLLLFIFPSFAFVGLEGYSRLSDGDNAVAKVAGQTITKEEWDAAQRQQLERLRQMSGGQIDAKVFDTPE